MQGETDAAGEPAGNDAALRAEAERAAWAAGMELSDSKRKPRKLARGGRWAFQQPRARVTRPQHGFRFNIRGR
jgi:hypothetical protein